MYSNPAAGPIPTTGGRPAAYRRQGVRAGKATTSRLRAGPRIFSIKHTMRETMAYQYRFGTKLRDQTFALEKLAAYKAGRGELPICIHCDAPVMIGDAWDVAHVTVPRAFGGKSVACGHRRCNQLDNNLLVTPADTKAARVHRYHAGTDWPGLGHHSMQGRRRTPPMRTPSPPVKTTLSPCAP